MYVFKYFTVHAAVNVESYSLHYRNNNTDRTHLSITEAQQPTRHTIPLNSINSVLYTATLVFTITNLCSRRAVTLEQSEPISSAHYTTQYTPPPMPAKLQTSVPNCSLLRCLSLSHYLSLPRALTYISSVSHFPQHIRLAAMSHQFQN